MRGQYQYQRFIPFVWSIIHFKRGVIINNYLRDSNKLVYTVILQVIHTVWITLIKVINNKKRLKTVICGELSSVIHTFSSYLCNIL